MLTPIPAAAAALLCAGATAAVPSYSTIELQARSNFTVNGGGFNLPGDAFFGNATPAINAGRQVAFRLNVIGGTGTQGIWLGADGAGSIVYQGPFDGSISDPSLNDAGLAIFEQFFVANDGIYFHDSVAMTSGVYTEQPFGASFWTSPDVNSSGAVGYRGEFFGGAAGFYIYDGRTAELVASNASLMGSSPYSFLFTPSFSDAGVVAGKVRRGTVGQTGNERPDEIRTFAPGGASTAIARDVDANASSPYASFDNSVSITPSGSVAFIATLVGGGRGVFLSDGVTTVEIATTNDPALSEIEFFSPSANDAGLVTFRGRDAAALRAVWVGDGTTLAVVAREHDVLPTDLGPGRIDQNDSSPVFGGAPRINAHGDVAFHCTLTPEDDDQVEWGSGIYVAIADPGVEPCPGDLDGSGGVGFADLNLLLAAWGPCPDCPEDLDGSGGVGFADLNLLLAGWGPCP